TDWSWAPLIADFDHDGFQDIYITNGYGKDITDLDFVKFRKDAIKPFVEPEEIQKILLNSLDDLPAIVLPNYAYKNKGDHTFENTVESWGFSQPSISNGAVYADLDLDGDLEIITNNIDRPAFIYKNTTRERDSSHFLQVKLIGGKMNRSGTGSVVSVYRGTEKRVRYQQPVKGFQSSVTDIIHFGLGESTMIDSLSIIWPDGKRNVMFEISADQLITINYNQAKLFEPKEKHPQKSLLTKSTILTHQYKETILTDDFKNQPLLIHGFSQQGPGMAVGDVNHDNLDDIFIGGAYGESASLYLQMENGSFTEQKLPTEDYEDLGALFLDIDNDQDLDLFVTSGGAERFENHPNYQDRIYLNDGKGNFTRKGSLLPSMLTSTSTARGGDFDQDGDVDLFIGGRVIPGKFPVSPQSYLLRNTGGQFKDVTDQVCPELKHIGMVTSAIWTDFNNDHLQDLIVVGEMMKISIFQNDGKKLLNITDKAGLASSTGMWNSITSGDFDLDGDMDYVVGNIGKNTPFDISHEHPLQLHFADFDENGSVDPIYSIWEEDDYYPLASLDLLTQQLPQVKRETLHYRTYAKSTTTADILNLLNESACRPCNVSINQAFARKSGNNHFSMIELPLAAQIAPVKGMLVEDLNIDGLPDLILVGNEYNTEVVSGRGCFLWDRFTK
ncbi:MAG: FG-GAP-like repeat-containing protein, partial [Bacteroidia bacterium]